MTFNVLILAGGFGTRLGDFGIAMPKGLIQVGDSTILDFLLNLVSRSNAQTITLISNQTHLPAYQAWRKTTPFAIQIIGNGISRSEDRAGALADAAKVIQTKPLEDWLILPSDTLFDFSLSDFLATAQGHIDGLTTVLRAFPHNKVIANRLGCGVVSGERLIDFKEKPLHPETNLGAIPLYYFPVSVVPILLEYVSSHPHLPDLDAPGIIIPWLIAKHHPVYAHIVSGNTLDVGTIRDLASAADFKVK